MGARYSVGWSDARGTFGNVRAHLVYRKEYQATWTNMLPEKFRRYKIMCGDVQVAEQLTSDEADAMIKLLEASRE